MTHAERIRQTLARRPYWGMQRVAAETGIDYGVVRSTAAREGIRFWDRQKMEVFTDTLVEAVESIETPNG